MQVTGFSFQFEKELQYKRHDGVYRWHLSRALPLRNEAGAITSWVSTTTDVHDQKMFSEELEKKVTQRTELLKNSNIALQHANKNLEQFTFIASHDLQEPLRKIRTFSDILSKSFSDKLTLEGLNFLQKIQKSSERMSELIKDVLSFSQVENLKNIFLKTSLDDIFNAVVSEFHVLIEERKATVEKDTLPVLDVIPVQVKQLFYNLLSNSLKFTRDGVPPVITVKQRVLTKTETLGYPTLNQANNYCEIIFSDNGIGIEPQYCHKIFEIFQRLHTRDKYPGTGIGLAMCKKIVLNHHGEILATCTNEPGLLIRIILPLVQVHNDDAGDSLVVIR